jgi:hypothetical protein
MTDKYHKVINGKTVAVNLPKKATTLTEKQKKELEKIVNSLNLFTSKL